MKYDLFPYSGSVTYIWDRYEEIASFLCSILTLLISPHLMGDKDSSQRHPFLCRPSYVIFLILVKSYVVLLRIHNLTLVQISTGITDPPPYEHTPWYWWQLQHNCIWVSGVLPHPLHHGWIPPWEPLWHCQWYIFRYSWVLICPQNHGGIPLW